MIGQGFLAKTWHHQENRALERWQALQNSRTEQAFEDYLTSEIRSDWRSDIQTWRSDHNLQYVTVDGA